MEPDRFASVSKSVLDIHSLNDVLDACKECAVSWNPVGLYLGLRHYQLDEIAAMTTVPRERLQRVLAAWLKKDTISGSPDPSYYALCHAVAKRGTNPALAGKIAAAHPATAATASPNSHQKEPKALDSTRPKSFDVLLQSIGVQPSLVTSDDRIIEVDTFNCNSFKDIITDPRNTVKVRPVLISFGGLPESGKTQAFTSFKKHYVMSNPLLPLAMKNRLMATCAISHYDLVAAVDHLSRSLHITEATKESSCVIGLLSAFKQQFLENGRVPLLDPMGKQRCFKKSALNEHLRYMYQYIYESLPTGPQGDDEVRGYANKLTKLFPEESALINVWDIPTNKTVRDVLSALQGHLTNNHMWLFLSLERDLDNLHLPPEINERSRDGAVIMKWRPRLHYLLRSCRLSESQGEWKSNMCALIVKHTNLLNEGLKKELTELQDEVKLTAKHMGVSRLLDSRIETIQSNVKCLSQKIHSIIHRTPITVIPIAWVFLRSFFHCYRKRFISKQELKELAAECGMNDSSVIEFCKFYTSFGSIFDLSLVDPQYQYVIIKPIHFLRSLDHFLHPSSDDDILRHFPSIAYGIVPEIAAREAFGDDWVSYIDALVCLNLGTEVSSNYLEAVVPLDPNDKYYYIPLSCTGPLIQAPDPESVHLIASINTPCVFTQTTFTRHLLSSLPQPKLVPCINSNQTIIRDTSTDTTVTLVSYGPATKLHLDKPNGVVCSAVVRAYDEMARSSPVTVKYKFVKMCVEGKIPDARHFPAAASHTLPNKYLCEECQKAGRTDDDLLKVWNEALAQNPIGGISTPCGQLTSPEIPIIADKIASYDIDVIAETFGFPNYKNMPELNVSLGPKLVVESILFMWERHQQEGIGTGLETRNSFARTLSQLGHNLSSRDLKKETKVYFEKLASKVDLYHIPQIDNKSSDLSRIDQRYLQAAMKGGSVHSRITKAVVQGEARAGKTSLKCLLLKLPYDKLSTSCIEAPQVAYGSFSVNRYCCFGKRKCWTLVEDKNMTDKVLTELKSIAEEKQESATTPVDSANTQLQFDQSEPVQNSDTDRDLQLIEKENVSLSSGNNISTAPKQPSSASPQNNAEPFPMHSAQSDDSIQVSSANKDEEEAIAKVKELYEKCKDVQKEERLSLHQEWLYFIDSGGQIQFQKLLPAFMPFASVLILVLNLAKGLSDPACTKFQQKHDQQISVSKHSPTVEEILKQLLSAIASCTEQFDSLIVRDAFFSPYIKPPPSKKLSVISVATHRDEYNQLVKNGSAESLNAKEVKLRQIFDSLEQKCTIVCGETPLCDGKILHEVDGSKAERSEYGDPVVDQIAELLKEQAYEVEVPIRWYCFHVLLRTIAKEGCGVLSVSYCQALGEQLEMSEGEVESALKFLHILNMLLYYPDSPAADLVFVQLDSLVNIIRDLVVLVCTARPNWLAKEGDIKKLATKGLLSVKVLEKSSNFRKVSNNFPKFGSKLLGLFQDLLIAVRCQPMEDYYMPVLLPVKNVSDPKLISDRTPLLFFFKNSVPVGLFCAFIVRLLKQDVSETSDYGSSNSSVGDSEDTSVQSTCTWQIIQSEDLNWSNYFTLQYNKRDTFVFVERLNCIEVHTENPNVHIRKVIGKAIRAAIKKRKLKEKVEKAFYCNCSVVKETRHVALVHKVDQDYALRCEHSERYDHNLDKEKSAWLKKKSVKSLLVSSSIDETCGDKDSNMKEKLTTTPSEELLKIDIIGELKTFPVDISSGLTYHCSQYSLIIPEGAVPAAATVWCGSCTFSDKFQFEDGYTPVTPIVWIYIDCVLTKPAQLRLPHHIDVKNMAEPEKQLCLMKATDEFSSDDNITLKYCKHDIEIESTDHVNISLSSFCFLCIGIKNYTEAPKRYVMARIDEKKSGQNFDVHFCFLYDRSDCKEMLKLQYPGIADPEYRPVNLEPGAEIKPLFNTCIFTIPGWKPFHIPPNLCITEAMIDDRLSMKKAERLYPPRFTLPFELQDLSEAQKSRVREVSLTVAVFKEGAVLRIIDNAIIYLNINGELSTEAALSRGEGEVTASDSSLTTTAATLPQQQHYTDGQQSSFDPQLGMKTFRKHYGDLSDLMALPHNRLAIAPRLFSAELITEACLDEATENNNKTGYERGSALMAAIRATVNGQPQLIMTLIEVLKKVEAFQQIAEKLYSSQ